MTDIDEKVEVTPPVVTPPANNDGAPADTGASNDDSEVVMIDEVEYKVDAEGNALDATGTVFKTKAELDEMTPIDDTIKIGESEFKKDAEGNLVNDKGEIVYTKEEADGIENPTSIVHLMETTGIRPIDDKGQRIIYPNTIEGHNAYIQDVATIQSNAAVNKAFGTFLKNNPDIEKVIRYKKTYGTIDGYNAKTDYTDVELTKDNPEVLENVILTARLKRGDTPEAAKRYIEFLKQSDGLLDEAKIEQSYINELHIKEGQLREAARLKEQRDAAIQEQKFWGEVQSTINAGVMKIDGTEYKIPKVFQIEDNGKIRTATSDDFVAYISEPIKVKDATGRERITTRYELDEDNFHNRNGASAMIFNALSFFMKKPTKLVEEQIATRKVKEVRKLVSTASDKNKQNAVHRPQTGKIDYTRD